MQPRYRALLSIALVSGIGGFLVPGANARESVLLCQSDPGGYQFCRSATGSGVELVDQLSQFACVKDDTWGYDAGGIWVANGCSARFRLGTADAKDPLKDAAEGAAVGELARALVNQKAQPRKRSEATIESESSKTPGATTPTPLGDAVIVSCSSSGYERQFCPAPVKVYVEVKRRQSKALCKFNDSWGYDLEAIWVAKGCRAEFAVY